MLADRILEKNENGNVTILWNHTLEEVVGDTQGVTGVRFTARRNKSHY